MPDFDPDNMTYLVDDPAWEDSIFKLENGYLPTGGDVTPAGGGTMNRQAQGLANRTTHNRAAIVALQQAVANGLTQADLDAAIAGLVDGAPGALDTLKELGDAFGNDPDFAATVTQSLAGKLSQADVDGGAIDGRFYRKDEWSGGFGATGWQRFPSGLIMQWGASATASNYTYITFPLAFPNGCRSVTATHDFVTYATNLHLVMMAGSITNTQAVFRGNINGDGAALGQLSSAPFWWLAIGD
ncbi:hypothetical protein [Cognatishimia sp. MH4019]|uniref:gp53-like domain-containing protein n=1 Tax=Cognatishimia sp. MH4019 TaxID=2854030 RepID=UPI001CD7561A|nr:hypothetical protein [Cognatishimia sp. MH4019]